MATLTIVSKSLNADVNMRNHHTEKIPSLYALRRGQLVTLSVVFNRQLQPSDRLKFTAVLMDFKRVNTLMNKDVPIIDSTSRTAWSARKVSTGANNSVNFEIYPPVDAVIGNYSLNASTAGGNYNLGNFVLLFNPWIPDDAVYISDSVKRRVYHDETFTYIWRGTETSYSAIPWDFGQWEDGMLSLCLKLLENTKDPTKRNDPIRVCRDFSAMVNAQDERGILEGNWSGDYKGGTSPSAWNGSYSILSKYAVKYEPVKYGQCWVFAGVLCTVLRCLGIPARVITNFSSAHDTDRNVTIERFINYKGESTYYNNDSIWNYHCWVEAWMSRAKDLGQIYSGWQVVDATPQEQSSGRYCCGPASLKAIKEGEVDKDHDTLFVVAEVNSDVVFYYLNEDESINRMSEYTASVGTLICTMALDMRTLENITLDYKYKEGTEAERNSYDHAYEIAQGFAGFRAMSPEAASAVIVPGVSPIEGKIVVSDNLHVGEEINISVNLKNKTDQPKEANVTTNCKSMVYNGMTSNNIMVETQRIALGPNAGQIIPIKLTYAQYQKPLTPDNIINIVVLCDVKNEPTALIEVNINLKNPTIEIKTLEQATVGKPFQVEVSFFNPLERPVKDCVVTMEGSGLTRTAVVKKIASIAAKQTGMLQFELTPTNTGNHLCYVNLTSDMFKDIKGSQPFNVA